MGRVARLAGGCFFRILLGIQNDMSAFTWQGPESSEWMSEIPICLMGAKKKITEWKR